MALLGFITTQEFDGFVISTEDVLLTQRWPVRIQRCNCSRGDAKVGDFARNLQEPRLSGKAI